MRLAETIPAVAELSPEKKWQLANELWEEVEASNTAYPLREDHVELLEDRWKVYRENPENVNSWDDIKKRIGKD